jgi:arogenate dehydrogenase (NADP+)
VVIGAALLQTAGSDAGLAQKLASSGFADTTRVGGGNPQLGRLMAQMNRSALLEALNRFQGELQSLKELIERQNWQQLEQELNNCQHHRAKYV